MGFSKMIAEMLQDRLDYYIDVSVGNAKKINPSFLIEEKLDYLIIGDVHSKEIPSLELQRWLQNYWELSRKKKRVLKAISGFYIALADIRVEPFWVESLYDNVKTEIIYPPILSLKLNSGELALENGVHDLIKEYSNDFIEFLINKRKRKKKKNY